MGCVCLLGDFAVLETNVLLFKNIVDAGCSTCKRKVVEFLIFRIEWIIVQT